MKYNCSFMNWEGVYWGDVISELVLYFFQCGIISLLDHKQSVKFGGVW